MNLVFRDEHGNVFIISTKSLFNAIAPHAPKVLLRSSKCRLIKSRGAESYIQFHVSKHQVFFSWFFEQKNK